MDISKVNNYQRVLNHFEQKGENNFEKSGEYV